MDIGKDELKAFQETARSFAKRSVGPILDHESPDGDLARVPAILDEAYATGLLASPSPDAPGFEAGVFGRHALEHGPRLSLLLLEELATACAGVAMNLHAAGLAALIAGMAKEKAGLPDRMAVALAEGGFPPGPGTLADPAAVSPYRIETEAKKIDRGFLISGRKDFVFHAHGTRAFIVFARMDDSWAAFVVAADAKGLSQEDAGHRMGLRACPLSHLVMKEVEVSEARLEFTRPVSEVVIEYQRLNWLGLLALATGSAQSALAAARQYAGERYQGCTEIINHPGVNAMLLADSEAAIMVCQSLIEKAAMKNGSPSASLAAAAKAKLAGSLHAARAVTDSLQVFGGYGYMEDYRMEKRYRDVNTLKCAAGGPRDLRVIIAALAGEA